MNPPKPTELKILAGNPGHRPLNRDEPTPPLGAEMPATLSPEAQKHWPKIAKQLEDARILSTIDAMALGLFCEASARWENANAELIKTGLLVPGSVKGKLVQSPHLRIADRAFTQMHKLLQEFGMTPASRSRVSKVPNLQKHSRLLDLLNGGRDVE